mmetsp:Transcript_22973/g.63456  ORF Transcript_22973/g.63456 Transcript_22973/m.63456 type:complete len:254 (+) Transcript_22973:2864-3625(+)
MLTVLSDWRLAFSGSCSTLLSACRSSAFCRINSSISAWVHASRSRADSSSAWARTTRARSLSTSDFASSTSCRMFSMSGATACRCSDMSSSCCAPSSFLCLCKSVTSNCSSCCRSCAKAASAIALSTSSLNASMVASAPLPSLPDCSVRSSSSSLRFRWRAWSNSFFSLAMLSSTLLCNLKYRDFAASALSVEMPKDSTSASNTLKASQLETSSSCSSLLGMGAGGGLGTSKVSSSSPDIRFNACMTVDKLTS